jgi:hypothetical protein
MTQYLIPIMIACLGVVSATSAQGAGTKSCKDYFPASSATIISKGSFLVATGQQDPKYMDKALRRVKAGDYLGLFRALSNMTQVKESQEVEMDLDLSMLAKRGFTIKSSKPKIRGRVMKVGSWPLPEIVLDLANYERVILSLVDIVPGSVSAPINAPLRRPPLPQGLKLPSAIAQFDGVSNFVHATTLEHLDGVLTSKAILPVSHLSKVKTDALIEDQSVVYLEPISTSMSGESLDGGGQFRKERPIKLIFDPTVMDQKKFYLNRGWPFGKISSDTAWPADLAQLHNIFWDVRQEFVDEAELTFQEPVDLKSLIAIFVIDETSRKQVIELLKKHEFVPSSGKSIEEFVVTQKTWP